MLWLSDPEEADCFEITVVLLRPRSRGRVRLRSANPLDPPAIELPALTEQTDVDRIAEGCARALELGNHRAVRAHCPGPPPTAPDGDLREGAWSLPHAVGTCAMGMRPEEGAVVDASGRVHGTEGVSIVDASIMPEVPSGFTHLSTIMIAERLADAVP
jgi:choline dehydrogenase